MMEMLWKSRIMICGNTFVTVTILDVFGIFGILLYVFGIFTKKLFYNVFNVIGQ